MGGQANAVRSRPFILSNEAYRSIDDFTQEFEELFRATISDQSRTEDSMA